MEQHAAAQASSTSTSQTDGVTAAAGNEGVGFVGVGGGFHGTCRGTLEK